MPQSLEEDIQSVVRLAGNATDAFTAALFLLDERRGDVLRLRACQSLSTSIVHGAEIPIGRGLVGWVAKNERPTHATNFGRDTTTLKFYSKDEDIKSFAAAPLFDEGGRVMGVLSIDSKKSYVFTDKALKLLGEFAGVLARTISGGSRRIKLGSKASAFDALSDIIEKLKACARFSEMANVLRLSLPSLIPHDHLALAVKSADDGGFHIARGGAGGGPEGDLPLTHYRLGWVIQQARSIYIPDLKGAQVMPGGSDEWKSFLGAPMMTSGHVSGAVGLVSKKQAAFGQVDSAALSILASSLSSAFTSVYLHGKSSRAVFTDPLTRVATHRYLVESHPRPGGKGAVSIVNIVGFTRINHELGMGAGDMVTIETARRLREVVADRGLVCRYYGDRFILFLRDMPPAEARALAQAVVDSIEAVPYKLDGVDIYASPSIGMAVYPGDGGDIEELIAKAQVASERAKTAGGARFCFYADHEAPYGGAFGTARGQ